MTPTVSVIIPVYNAADVLAETLASLQAQTLQDFEVICVDDGSTDASAHVVRTVAAADGRFSLLSKPNGGAASARNLGLDHARGTYVICLDADDRFLPRMLEDMSTALATTQAEVCVCEVDNYFYQEGRLTPRFRFPQGLAEGVHRRAEFGRRFFQTFNKPPYNKMYLRSFVTSSGIRYQDLPNTNDAFFVEATLATCERIAILKTPYAQYRRGQGTSLQDTRHKHPDAPLRAADKLYDYLIGRNVLCADEALSLKNECWRLAVAAVESAASAQEAMEQTLPLVRELQDKWGISRMRPRDYTSLAYAFWHWAYLRSSPQRLVWVYQIRRRPVAERQTLATNLYTAVRLLVAALSSPGS